MTAIEFDNVGKQYRLGLVSTQTLSHDLHRWWTMNVLRKEDPYLKIGETNDRSVKGNSDYVWALKDINFKVEQGDVVGIIGRNGAGKSTLLKLLSRVTAPTTGEIRSRGRIGSLLEVGTGFHPEMTGRENIYMNGAIMGMTRSEINRKLDDIVDFSGCSRYLDTPVKRYSSGMTVRLGFAVAAFLEPEILVVDEVLAVGDAEFQKKAIGKMKDVSQGEGRTVLFVSHNMNAVKMLCNHAVVLRNGGVEMIGNVDECVGHYLQNISIKDIVSEAVFSESDRDNCVPLLRDISIISAKLLNDDPSSMATDEPIQMILHLSSVKRDIPFQLCFFFINTSGVRVSFCMTSILKTPCESSFEVAINIPNHHLPKGRYSVRLEVNFQDFSMGSTHYDFINSPLSFEIKYIHKEKKDEYLFWNSEWGQTLQIENLVDAKIL